MKRGTAAVILMCCACAGPQAHQEADRPPEASWRQLTKTELTPPQRAQHEQALAAQQAMARELMQELVTTLDSGGPVDAISVCHERAPAIAAEVARQHGVLLGRTSHRLRNPSNRAPAWAEDFVSQQVAEPVLLAGPQDRLGVLLPIRLQPECGICHGEPEAIADEVRTVLNELYPEDAATGFAAGDLRGWFWIEVPG